jgi:hypothetical protein
MRGGVLVAAAIAAQSAAACSEPCCTYDSQPIALEKGKHGELLAHVSVNGLGDGPALIDTGSPISLWNTPGDGAPQVQQRDVRILGPRATMGAARLPTRAILRKTATVGAPLAPIDGTDAVVQPVLLLGGDLLVNFSIEIGFSVPEMVIWPEERATDGFLSGAGYAVLHTNLRGAGQLEALAPSDGIGPRGPYQYPSSLLVLRACGAPRAFDRQERLPARCCIGDERALSSGADLSLLLATGVGPIVLGRSAWTRITAQLTVPPAEVPGTLRVATAASIDAAWSTLPRLALVDRQADPSVDPGPCVELGRSRRLEQVDLAQSQNATHAACALPCDQDPTKGRSQDSAAYLELAGALPVAIVADGEQLLQTARAEVRPDGPEIDGLLGAGALALARVELDYRSPTARAIFSCEAGATTTDCRTVGSCPRLPSLGQTHTCFGLPTHALPQICDNQTACE